MPLSRRAGSGRPGGVDRGPLRLHSAVMVPRTDPPVGARPPRGVLLVNLGSPAAPTPAAVRAFLAEFLGDPMVVDLNPLVWWAIRNLIVTPCIKPRRTARR